MTDRRPGPWKGEGNDYRGIRHLEPGPPPSVAVLVPDDSAAIRNAVDSQAYEGTVDVFNVSDAASVGKAGERDVVVICGEAIPADGWLEAHSRWHRRADNVVVLGPCPDEERSHLVRGSRLLLGNDEGFAALTPCNVSLPGHVFALHPDLDPVAGWRLWNDGFFFAYEPEAVSSDHPAVKPYETDEIALADVIPHRRFRSLPSAFYSVPKVSWVVAARTSEDAMRSWETCRQATYPDQEVVFHGPEDAVSRFRTIAASNPRVSVVAGRQMTFRDAVAATRGELVAVLDARADVAPETLAKTVARFEAKPSAPVVRVGYDMAGDRYLRLDDLAAIDTHLGDEGLPLLAVVARRELSKDPSVFDTPETGWSDTLARCDQSLVVSPLVEMAVGAPFQPDRPGLREVTATGLRETAKAAVRAVRRRRAADQVAARPHDEPPANGRVSVAYVGFTGHDNLGDEAVRVAIERLMPWAAFETDPPDPKLLMVGGGTLINGRRYYLNRMLRQESASIERALFGTGVRSPEYWGVTEPMEDWFSFIDSSLFAAVRGPDSVENMRTLGYGRDLPVIGDPALYLEPPPDVARVEGRVVVCPVYTSGNLHGGDDDVVFIALGRLIARLRSEGREVVMLSAFPQDDRWVIDIMRRAGAPDLPYLAGYADIDETMRLLASADIVVGERLHAAIMAASAGTPFVGLEYRPKLRDFGRSVDQEDAILRTDQMERLDEVFDSIVARRDTIKTSLDRRVADYRKLQADAAEALRRQLTEL